MLQNTTVARFPRNTTMLQSRRLSSDAPCALTRYTCDKMAAGITGIKPNVFDPHKKKQLKSLGQVASSELASPSMNITTMQITVIATCR